MGSTHHESRWEKAPLRLILYPHSATKNTINDGRIGVAGAVPLWILPSTILLRVLTSVHFDR